ncbi:MAG: MFS transporter, partial [bacterium]|nr:MFS transporter [bacterium]
FSQVMAISTLVPVFGPTVGAAIMRIFGWRGLVAFLGLIALGILIAAFRMLPDTNATTVHETRWLSRMRSDGSALARDRDFVGYAVVLLLASAAYFASTAASSFVLQGDFGMTPIQYSIVVGINGIGVILVSLVASKRVRVSGPRRLLVTGLGLLLLTSALLLGATAGSLPLLLAGLFTLNLGVGLIFPAARALAPHKHALRAGSAYAILGVTQFVVSGLAAPLTGLLPWALLTSLGVVVAFLSVGAVGALFITDRTTAERPTATA